MTKEIWQPNNFAEIWLRYWIPPAKPTKPELIFIKKMVCELKKKNKNIDILILGSTIEYRDLMIRLGIKATIVDFSQKNYRIMSKSMKYKFQGKEKFVLGDWRQMNLDKQFDLILADASLNMLDKKLFKKLIKNINRHLKQDGYFLSKTWIRYSDKKPNLISFIDHNRKRIKNTSFYEAAAPIFELYFYNFKKDCFIFRDIWKGIKGLYEKGIVGRKEFNQCNRLGFDKFESQFFMPKKDWIEKEFRKYWNIKTIKIFDFWLNKYFPIYVLKKK